MGKKKWFKALFVNKETGDEGTTIVRAKTKTTAQSKAHKKTNKLIDAKIKEVKRAEPAEVYISVNRTVRR